MKEQLNEGDLDRCLTKAVLSCDVDTTPWNIGVQ